MVVVCHFSTSGVFGSRWCCFLPSQAQLTFIALTCCVLSRILFYNFVSGSWRGDLVPRWHKGLLEILLDPGSVWGLGGSGWVLREQSLVLTSTDRAGLYIWPVEEQTDRKAETFNILICFGVLLSHVAAHLSLRKHPISLVSFKLARRCIRLTARVEWVLMLWYNFRHF